MRQFKPWISQVRRGRREDKARVLEETWRKFFEDRSQWLDIRFKKKNSKVPDFVHVTTKEGLWIDGWSNPPWVAAELASSKQDGEHCDLGVKALPTRDSSQEGQSTNSIRVAKEDPFVYFEHLRTHCDKGQLTDALQAVEFMHGQGTRVSTDIFYCLLQGCIKNKDLTAGRDVHGLIRRSGLEADAFLGSHLIRMFALCDSLSESNQVFRDLSEKNVYTWSVTILANVKLGQAEESIRLYHQMQRSTVKPNDYIFVAVLKACVNTTDLKQGKMIHVNIFESVINLSIMVGNTLIDMYAKCGSLEDAKIVFDQLHKRTLVSWTAMITGYVQHGHSLEALQLYEQMQKVGMEPDMVTFGSILKACSSILALDQGKAIHSYATENSFELDVILGSTLIELYAKCGCLEDASRVFDKLPKRDSVTWTAIIAAYSIHSNYQLALHYFNGMQQEGLRPDGVTFVCLLSACSHIGLVDKGFQHFKSMTRDHGIKPTLNHYDCLVDLLCRAGRLGEAKDLLQTTPFVANVVGWTSLLSSCSIYGNVCLGQQCFESMIIMEPKDASGYMLMSRVYADAEMRDNIDNLHALRKIADARKKPGKAFIEMGNRVHEFVVGDKNDLEVMQFMQSYSSFVGG